jgi:hypothetical protein
MPIRAVTRRTDPRLGDRHAGGRERILDVSRMDNVLTF